ncbi:site-specific integrase [Verrucomicrobium sp. BvORR034]|uniref:tyrosine-type recombinase/integrase n=1 Tax=Verrucomicrobium sp. BvORR034 TaxID=1396418 RepID=UPI00067895F3|nr:site-specific integrase [Verrucomicrobium sp. BvORR034]
MKSGHLVKDGGQKAGPRKKQARSGAQKISGLTQINGWFYYRPAQVKGMRPRRIALDTQDFDTAVQLALQYKRTTDQEYRAGSIAFEAKRFLAEKKRKNASEWTVDSDESAIKLFCEFVGGETMISGISAAKMEQWRDFLAREGKVSRKRLVEGAPKPKGKPLSDLTVKTYVTRVGTFFEWLKDQGGLVKNVVREVEVPNSKKTRVELFCQKAERDVLFSCCDREDMETLLWLGFHAGLRLNEIVQARPEWIRFWKAGAEWHGEIVVQETDTFKPKDREARSIPMNSELLRFMKNRKWEGKYLLHPEIERGKDKYRWNPRRPFKALVKKAGLSWVGVHTLRHTYATHLVMGGVPIAVVARWLGDDVKTTYETYAGYVPNRAHTDAGLTVTSPGDDAVAPEKVLRMIAELLTKQQGGGEAAKLLDGLIAGGGGNGM